MLDDRFSSRTSSRHSELRLPAINKPLPIPPLTAAPVPYDAPRSTTEACERIHLEERHSHHPLTRTLTFLPRKLFGAVRALFGHRSSREHSTEASALVESRTSDASRPLTSVTPDTPPPSPSSSAQEPLSLLPVSSTSSGVIAKPETQKQGSRLTLPLALAPLGAAALSSVGPKDPLYPPAPESAQYRTNFVGRTLLEQFRARRPALLRSTSEAGPGGFQSALLGTVPTLGGVSLNSALFSAPIKGAPESYWGIGSKFGNAYGAGGGSEVRINGGAYRVPTEGGSPVPVGEFSLLTRKQFDGVRATLFGALSLLPRFSPNSTQTTTEGRAEYGGEIKKNLPLRTEFKAQAAGASPLSRMNWMHEGAATASITPVWLISRGADTGKKQGPSWHALLTVTGGVTYSTLPSESGEKTAPVINHRPELSLTGDLARGPWSLMVRGSLLPAIEHWSGWLKNAAKDSQWWSAVARFQPVRSNWSFFLKASGGREMGSGMGSIGETPFQDAPRSKEPTFTFGWSWNPFKKK